MRGKGVKKNPWEDHYSRRAKKERYPARSVYKLKEIQQKYRLINTGDCVLDLGCAPGSWLVFAAELTGSRGRVVGIDLKPVHIPVPAWVQTHAADIRQPADAFKTLFSSGFHVVLSDMAPDTSGNKKLDALRSSQLSEAALDLALQVLKPPGSFVCKIFQGEGFQSFIDAVKRAFAHTNIFKPQSSRKASREIYVIGRCRR